MGVKVGILIVLLLINVRIFVTCEGISEIAAIPFKTHLLGLSIFIKSVAKAPL